MVDELATVSARRRRESRNAPLIMIIALALTVVNGELGAYKRGFAWLVLVSIWTVFRFSNMEWLGLSDDDVTELESGEGHRHGLHRLRALGPPGLPCKQ